jgi:serine/threonine-protein kinase HipA
MRSQQPFSVWDGTVRLSVAGYQDKLGVLLDEDAWFLVDGDGLASTHLLKPEPTRSVLAGLTTNEFACLTLARAVGVPAAEAALVHVPEPVLMLTRFDRQFSGGRIWRKPVIDGCQALGLPVHLKYERPYGSGQDVAHLRDGASYPALFALVRRHAAMPLETSRDLLRLAIFNVLIGNVDAHAKNLTFFVSSAGLRLAPAYDLVSRFGIAASVDSNFAFAIGDAFSGADLTPYAWAQFAEDCRISPRLVAVELASLAGRLAEAWPLVQAQVRAAGGASDVLARIGQCLLQECERQRELAREVVHVPRSAVRRDGPA